MEESQPSRDSSIIGILSITTGYITFFFSCGKREAGTPGYENNSSEKCQENSLKAHLKISR